MPMPGALGVSGHTNIADYRHGVLIGNWQENGAARGQARADVLGFTGPFNATSVSHDTYTAEGKQGADLAQSYKRMDVARSEQCMPASLKFTHGDPLEAPVECLATLNQLTYGDKYLGEPRVQAYLWCGRNKKDAQVPISGSNTQVQTMSATKRTVWHQEEDTNPYVTTSKATALSTAMLAAGMGPSNNAKAQRSGVFSAELDAVWHKIGLRGEGLHSELPAAGHNVRSSSQAGALLHHISGSGAGIGGRVAIPAGHGGA